jgi:hypothetical protein
MARRSRAIKLGLSPYDAIRIPEAPLRDRLYARLITTLKPKHREFITITADK